MPSEYLARGGGYHLIRVIAGLGAALVLGSVGLRWGWTPGLAAAALALVTGGHGVVRLLRPSRSPLLPLYLDGTTIGGGVLLTQAPLALVGMLVAAVVVPAIALLRRAQLAAFLAVMAGWTTMWWLVPQGLLGSAPLSPDRVATLSGAFVALFIPVIAGLVVVNGQLHRQLRRSERRFRALVQNSADVIAVLAPDGAVRYVSPAAERWWGHRPDDLMDRPVTRLVHPADLRHISAAVDDQAGDRPVEVRIRHRDGSWRHVEAVVSDRRADPTISGWVVNLRDVTERREAQERLRELVRSKDEFIASVSHELRTPLTGVLGFAQELRDAWRTFSSDEAIQLAELVATQAEEVSFIVEDLLVAARSDIGTVEVVPERVDLRAEARVLLGGRGALTGDDVLARADTVRVRQIVRNLLANARRHGGEHIEVVVGSTADGAAFLEVRDDGPGVPPEHRDRIFDPYHRGDGIPGQPSSVGLGLTVSRELARLMGGDLTYRQQDERSTFRLTLPAWDARISTG